MKILISGAGITGNALAFWFSKIGHDVTVIERHPTMRSTGLQIDLRGHGVEVLKRMGLEPAFRSKQVPERGLQIVDANDRRWAYFPANKTGKGLQSFTTDAEIMRGDLCNIIYSATKDRAKYVFGTSIKSFEEHDGLVKVQLTNGSTDYYDLVVGADGMWSRTRKMMFGPDTKDTFRPLGDSWVGYFTMPRPVKEKEEYLATMFFAPDHRFVMTRRHDPHTMQVYIAYKSDQDRLKSAGRRNIVEEKEIFQEAYKDVGWQMTDILHAMKESKDFYCERMGLVTLDTWSQSRVTLVGDAAYCPTAMTGMGTTCGVVGAYILAGEISEHCEHGNRVNATTQQEKNDLARALKSYETKFRPFMQQVQDGVSDNTFSMIPSSPWGIVIMCWLLWLVALLRLNVLGKYVLREEVKGWDLPKYEQLLRVVESST